MLLSRHLGNPKAEHWVGAIDAFYPIIMTLLIIELPQNILEGLHRAKDQNISMAAEYWGISQSVFSYLLVFFIIYELFCAHRAIARCSSPSRRINRLNGLCMATVSLFPPIVYIVNQVRQAMLINTADATLDAKLQLARMVLWGILAAIYASFWLMSAVIQKVEEESGDSDQHRKTLKEIRNLAIRRLLYAGFLLYCVASDNAIAKPSLLGFSILNIMIFFEYDLARAGKTMLATVKAGR